MNQNARNQLLDAASNGDGFAITAAGLQLVDEQSSQENVNKGMRLIQLAAEHKNVLWAKSLWLYISRFRPLQFPVAHHALVSTDAMDQMQVYVMQGNVWAMTVLGKLLYEGHTTPQNKDAATRLLSTAATNGCLWAKELLAEYGIPTSEMSTDDLLRHFKDKNSSKFWLA